MAERKKTKKLINRPDDVIAELINGMVGAHQDILRLEGHSGRAIVAVDGPHAGKVGIVGGGSGHEPLFSGYVGRGLADACTVGNVFASPSPDMIEDTIYAADGGSGIFCPLRQLYRRRDEFRHGLRECLRGRHPGAQRRRDR